MQVILQENIPNLGKKFDVKNVKDGYARNFLIPKRLAVLATSYALKSLDRRKLSLEKAGEKLKAEAEKQVKKLSSEELRFKVKHSDGRVFGSITAKEISLELKNKGYSNFEVVLEQPIKTLGEHRVLVQFKNRAEEKVTVMVLGE